MSFYVLQEKGFALGNFVNCTPTIRHLFELHGEKIPVLFQTEYVAECYKDSPYIKRINKPQGRKIFGSDMINRGNNSTDIDFISNNVLGQSAIFKPFIDEVEPRSGDYGLFVNGSGSEEQSYLDRKSVPFEIQEIIKYNSKVPVYGTGSLNDQQRNIFEGSFGNIRESLSLIAGAKWVITNATGFYHVAGAMEKNQLALWKDCLRPRNENINENAIISNQNDWSESIIRFLNDNN